MLVLSGKNFVSLEFIICLFFSVIEFTDETIFIVKNLQCKEPSAFL